MRLALISDIHANDVALRTALYDAAQCGADVYASLGDIVGYGPSPAESVRLARDSFSVSILGNHDAAVCGLRGISDFSDYAAEAVRVQRGQLGAVEKTYLRLLPLVWHEGDVAMAHGDFTAPGEFRYIEDERAAAANFAVRPERIMFVGHTHEPCVWMFDETGSVTKLPPQNFKPLPNRRYIVNPGTVGFPRGGTDVCGTYVIYDDKEDAVYFRKVPFDMNAYSRALRAVGRDVERGRASRRIRSAVSTAMAVVLGVAALGVGALFFQKMAYDDRERGVETERKYVEVVTTNRVVQVVDKVTITNYVIEVWAHGKLKSSRTFNKLPVDFVEPTPAPAPESPPPAATVPDADDKLPVKPPSAAPENSKPVIDESRPYTVITPAQALALGGAYGGDEVYAIKNTNGTIDIVHLFTEAAKTKTFFVPKKNLIIPRTAGFLIVGGGGAGGGRYGGGGGGGGVVEKTGLTFPAGTAYIYVGEGGGRGDFGRNGEDSILTAGGITYTAIGGGAGAQSHAEWRIGFAGGSGGGGYGHGRGGKALQPLSATGGAGFEGGTGKERYSTGGGGGAGGEGEDGFRNAAGKGGVGTSSSLVSAKGNLLPYAAEFYGQGGYGEHCAPKPLPPVVENTGNGGHRGAHGCNGVVAIRYVVAAADKHFDASDARATSPCANGTVKSQTITGVKWRYFVENGAAVIGCHGEKSINHPDVWTAAVDLDALEGEVQIPSRLGGIPVRKIGKGAFQGCTKVTKFTIPEGVKVCEARAFARCERLEEIVYPKSLERLGEGQIYRSPKVKNIEFKGGPPRCGIAQCPFKGCPPAVKISIPYADRIKWLSTDTPWRDDFEKAFGEMDRHVCADGCHALQCHIVLPESEIALAKRTHSGFLHAAFPGLKRKDPLDLDLYAKVWKTADKNGADGKRLYLPPLYNSAVERETVNVYATMMHFNSGEEIQFKLEIYGNGILLVDGELCIGPIENKGGAYWLGSHNGKYCSNKNGWHSIAIITNSGPGMPGRFSGGAFYRRGGEKWRRFEATPDGKTFRVTPDDVEREIAKIARKEPSAVPKPAVPEPVPMPVFDESRPYTVITPAQALALGGAYGGDEVRAIKNVNGTIDIIHIFTEVAKTKSLVVPKENRILPRTARFLVVAGGGAGGGIYGGGGGGGGVLEKSFDIHYGTIYVYVGKGGDGRGNGLNGEDSLLTIGRMTFKAVGGGAGGMGLCDNNAYRLGRSGGSGGGGGLVAGTIKRITLPSGSSFQSDGQGKGCRGCAWAGSKKGGKGMETLISGTCGEYAKGGIVRAASLQGGDGPANTGSGGDSRNSGGDSKLHCGGSGIVIIRYVVKTLPGRCIAEEVSAAYPMPDKGVRTAIIDGVEWRYFIEQGVVVVGCHGAMSLNHPDLWIPAVDTNALHGVVRIPAEIGGMQVKKIGKGAFQGCQFVTKFVVPEGVQHCDARAFAKCDSLEAVVYPRSLIHLGEGQVYHSPRVRQIGFRGMPPNSERCSCPFKGHSLSARICVLSSNKANWCAQDYGNFHVCKHGCHVIPVLLINTPKE